MIGYTTGSTFDGVLNYRSTNNQVLKDVSSNVAVSYMRDPFTSAGGGHSFRDVKNTKDGSAT